MFRLLPPFSQFFQFFSKKKRRGKELKEYFNSHHIEDECRNSRRLQFFMEALHALDSIVLTVTLPCIGQHCADSHFTILEGSLNQRMRRMLSGKEAKIAKKSFQERISCTLFPFSSPHHWDDSAPRGKEGIIRQVPLSHS